MSKLTKAQVLALAAMRVKEAADDRLNEGSVVTTPTINILEAAGLVTVERWAAYSGIGSRHDRRHKMTQTWSATLTPRGAQEIASRHDLAACEQLVLDAAIRKARRGLDTSARQLGTERPDLTRRAQQEKRHHVAPEPPKE